MSPRPLPPSAPVRRRRTAAYLLIEVLLAMAILTMVTALVFRIIETTVRTTRDVTYLQSLQERVDGIAELLRQNFSSLPPVVQFQTKTFAGGTELVFRRASFHFTSAPDVPLYGTVALACQPQGDGRVTLAFYQEAENARRHLIDENAEDKVRWSPLLRDLEAVTWRFYDPRNRTWRPDWPDGAVRPSLVEFSFRIAGQKAIHRLVFDWPQTVL